MILYNSTPTPLPPLPTPGDPLSYPIHGQGTGLPVFNPEPPAWFNLPFDRFWDDPNEQYGLLWWAGVTLTHINAEDLLFLIGTFILFSVVISWAIHQVRNPPE